MVAWLLPLPFDSDGAVPLLLLVPVLFEPDDDAPPSSEKPSSSEDLLAEEPSSELRVDDEVPLEELPLVAPVLLCAVVLLPPRVPSPSTAAIPSEPAAADPTSVRRNAPARRRARSRSVIWSVLSSMSTTVTRHPVRILGTPVPTPVGSL